MLSRRRRMTGWPDNLIIITNLHHFSSPLLSSHVRMTPINKTKALRLVLNSTAHTGWLGWRVAGELNLSMDGKRKTPLCCAIRNRFVYLKRSRAAEDENNKHSLQVNDAPSSSFYTRQITICYLNNNSKRRRKKDEEEEDLGFIYYFRWHRLTRSAQSNDRISTEWPEQIHLPVNSQIPLSGILLRDLLTTFTVSFNRSISTSASLFYLSTKVVPPSTPTQRDVKIQFHVENERP